MDFLKLLPYFGCETASVPPLVAPRGRIPVARMLERLDACFAENDMPRAGELLRYWQAEAVSLGDLGGELTVVSEMLGYYRKTGERERALAAVRRAGELIAALDNADGIDGATVILNAATTRKAFGMPECAEPLYRAVEPIFDALPTGDTRRAGYYNNFALTLADLGDYAAAEAYYKKALALVEPTPATFGDAAITHINLAHLYETAAGGWDDRSSVAVERAERLLRDPRVPHNGYYAYVLSKCAPSFGHFGYFLTEREFSRLSAEIYRNNKQ